MKYSCIIVEDEPLAAKLIARHLEKIESLELIAICKNAMEAFEIVNTKKIDLMLLDIQMPKLSGVDFLKSLSNPPSVIFTTAYKDYAIEGYDLNIVDYLLKPISFERFLKAIDKFLSLKSESKQTEQNFSVNVNPTTEKEFLFIKGDKKVVKVFFKDLLYIKGYSEYIKIYTDKGTIITKDSLSAILERLPENHFFRVHKSYIVNTKHIHSFTSYSIEIKENTIPIGRTYKKEVYDFLGYEK